MRYDSPPHKGNSNKKAQSVKRAPCQCDTLRLSHGIQHTTLLKCTYVVQSGVDGGDRMTASEQQRARTRDGEKSVRTSVTLPSEIYENLSQIAKSRKVTVAWVIRDAAEKYINNECIFLK
jgi:hypothetical protein